METDYTFTASVHGFTFCLVVKFRSSIAWYIAIRADSMTVRRTEIDITFQVVMSFLRVGLRRSPSIPESQLADKGRILIPADTEATTSYHTVMLHR